MEVNRFIGKGGFGCAALWLKSDDDGSLLDEVVMKESREPRLYEYWPYEHDDPNDGAFSREAVVQSIINASNCENIVHLRAFKTYMYEHNSSLQSKNDVRKVPKVRAGIGRSYLEYCPYGDLETLRVRHRAFHRYLQEAFLWSIFHSLATAITNFEGSRLVKGKHSHLGWPSPHSDFILHFDLKPSNIFLGYEQFHEGTEVGGVQHFATDDQPAVYPTIKIGDFGCALPSSETDPKVHANGTTACLPPEIPRETDDGRPCIYGAAWDDPPNGKKSKHAFVQTNVWQVGKVMFDLAALGEIDWYDEIKAKTQADYKANHHSALPDFDRAPFREDYLWQKSPYTIEVTDLIRRCMSVKPEERPTSTELQEETRRMLHTRMQDPAPDSVSVRHPKLYFDGHEINKMSIEAMNCWHAIWPKDYFDTIGPGISDPDDSYGPLEFYPEQTWKGQPSGPTLPSTLLFKFFYKHAKILHTRKYRWRTGFLNDPRFVRIRSDRLEFRTLLPYDTEDRPGETHYHTRIDDSSDEEDVDDDDYHDPLIPLDANPEPGDQSGDGLLQASIPRRPQPPPFPLSARQIFVKEYIDYESIKRPQTAKTESLLRETWARATRIEREPFEIQAGQANTDYEKAMNDYKQHLVEYITQLSDYEKARQRSATPEDQPQRPETGFEAFVQGLPRGIDAQATWKNLLEEEHKMYEAEYEQRMRQFRRRQRRWNHEQGRPEKPASPTKPPSAEQLFFKERAQRSTGVAFDFNGWHEWHQMGADKQRLFQDKHAVLMEAYRNESKQFVANRAQLDADYQVALGRWLQEKRELADDSGSPTPVPSPVQTQDSMQLQQMAAIAFVNLSNLDWQI